MSIVIKEIIVKTTVDPNSKVSEQLDEIVKEVKQQVLCDLELNYGIDMSSSDRKKIIDR
ncbi:MAG: hypothetical protein IK017_08155 [Paludibacteraceae bacterium]|nr:hypothetical protein [Paludibacteraceae bacterium]MBR5972610.1 hypothetical protein [Paludibacteraceae bacterium]